MALACHGECDVLLTACLCVFFCAQTTYATSPYSDPVATSDLDPQPIVDEEEGLLWVVGPVAAVIFIVCIVIAILLFKR